MIKTGDKNYDLEKRTLEFSENVILFVRSLKKDIVNNPIISQLVRSSTSVGANYHEANGASSKKDFRNKIYLCKKEAQETKHWLRMLAKCVTDKKEGIKRLWQECQELTLIFQKITSSLRSKPKEANQAIDN